MILLGEGISRRVYQHPSDPTKVIKIEKEGYWQNQNEWDLWQLWKDDPTLSKWLAGCHSISLLGRELVMERTEDLERWVNAFDLPSWITETQIENFGRIGRRVVCRDYGYLMQRLGLERR